MHTLVTAVVAEIEDRSQTILGGGHSTHCISTSFIVPLTLYTRHMGTERAEGSETPLCHPGASRDEWPAENPNALGNPNPLCLIWA